MVRAKPTEAQILRWHKSLSSWGRWGPDDERGTLNLITDKNRAEAARLVQEGIVVSCARPINYEPSLDAPLPTRRFMLKSGEGEPGENIGRTNAMDAFLIAPHGYTVPRSPTSMRLPTPSFAPTPPNPGRCLTACRVRR